MHRYMMYNFVPVLPTSSRFPDCPCYVYIISSGSSSDLILHANAYEYLHCCCFESTFTNVYKIYLVKAVRKLRYQKQGRLLYI